MKTEFYAEIAKKKLGELTSEEGELCKVRLSIGRQVICGGGMLHGSTEYVDFGQHRLVTKEEQILVYEWEGNNSAGTWCWLICEPV